jgi:hypothetical protein
LSRMGGTRAPDALHGTSCIDSGGGVSRLVDVFPGMETSTVVDFSEKTAARSIGRHPEVIRARRGNDLHVTGRLSHTSIAHRHGAGISSEQEGVLWRR